jgi:outer membrane immunogenic protein
VRKFLLAGVALAVLAPAASAADLGSSVAAVAVVAPASFAWTGFYAGVHVGYGTGRAGFDAANLDANHRYSGGIYGVQLGANYQFANNVVLGLEATFAGANLNGSAVVDVAPPPFGIQRQGTSLNFLATFGPRLGYAFDRTLIYAKAGFAAASFTGWFQDDTGRNAGRNWRGGWFVGAGVEHAFAPNWTVKAEYNYIDLGSGGWNFGAGFPNFQTRMDIHTFTLGVNYLFSTGPAAVVARY